MPRFGGTPFALPDLNGATRRIVLLGAAAFFLLAIVGLFSPTGYLQLLQIFGLSPIAVAHGEIWQLVTYAFLNPGLFNAFLMLISLWFVGSLLESEHGSRWFTELFFVGVLAAGVTATIVGLKFPFLGGGLLGLSGALFALMVAVAVLHGDLQFLLFFVLAVKARTLVIILLLVLLAQSLGGDRIYALSQLGAALAGFLYARYAPRRGGFGLSLSEKWYGMRNNYYRAKRRKAAKKFEVYMKKQGRVVRFDGQGNYLDADDKKESKSEPWVN
jgi:membrane associated rhomboid family serine protease